MRTFSNRAGQGAGRVSVAITALALLGGCAATPGETFLTTKTPYQPRQAAASYAPAPPGFTPHHTQLVARHGTRGMTGMKHDLALLNMCRQAALENALTPLGQALMRDIGRLIEVQLLLGYGIDGIARPGYANLTRIGIDEHRQLALRVLQRQPALFAATGGRSIVVEHSGVDRARDSAYFFTDSLTRAAPQLAAAIEQAVLAGYPADAPVAQAAGVNRFTLYFHKLNARTDAVSGPADPHFATYRDSALYQQYLDSPRLRARLDEIASDPRLEVAARIVLERLFSKQFIDRLAARELRFSNEGTMDAVSADGKLHARRDGDGKTVLDTPVAALMALSALYEIAPGLQAELGRDFRPYIPPEQARLLAWANDAEDFFVKGPGAAQDVPVTYKMAEGLLADFFREAEQGSQRHLASFRFTHAEIIIPLAVLLGLPGSSTPVAAGQPFTYESNPWRGRDIAPYAANIQWDSVRNGQGRLLVRMLVNEQERDFKPACDGARFAAGSPYYDVAALRLCYQGGANTAQ
ncbi:histidine-type phosphatase [Massilia sp. DWR3-1-1]|uniref:histidine-type phosphatase n=1 Tax=Massilia sp. DWR3-1-1 TaxID=2804559 RepID=UPI003CE75BAC